MGEEILFADDAGGPWKLLTAPAAGGRARLVSFSADAADPPLWRGRSSVPASRRAYRVGTRTLVLLTPEGRVVRYDPVRDITSPVGRTGTDAVWTSYGEGGLLRDPGSGALLQVTTGGSWSYRPDRPALWAAPAAEGLVVVIAATGDDATGEIQTYERGNNEASGRLSGAFAPPAVVTAFGRELAVGRRGDGGWELVRVSLPGLEPLGSVDLPGPPDALAASPSSHELYAGVGDRLLVFDRSRLARRTERRFGAPIVELRPGLLGGPVLVRTAKEVHLVPWGEEGSRPVETEWRPDLPLSLPDGSALAVRGERIVRTRWDGGGETILGSGGRWWAPVRWIRPDAAPAVATADSTGVAGEEERVEGSSQRDTAATDTAGRPAREGIPEAGFYAVVVAARSRDGVERLVDELAAAGWPTAIHEWRDDAGRSWFRGLVGPYGTRPEAEQAARRLQRERGVSVWVKELGAGLSEAP